MHEKSLTFRFQENNRDRAPSRRGEPPRERGRRREPPKDTSPLEATEETSPRGVTEETKKSPSSKRGLERERERETENELNA